MPVEASLLGVQLRKGCAPNMPASSDLRQGANSFMIELQSAFDLVC